MLLHGKVLKVVKDAASFHFHFHIHAHQVCPTLSDSQDIHMPVVVQTNRSWCPGEELISSMLSKELAPLGEALHYSDIS